MQMSQSVWGTGRGFRRHLIQWSHLMKERMDTQKFIKILIQTRSQNQLVAQPSWKSGCQKRTLCQHELSETELHGKQKQRNIFLEKRQVPSYVPEGCHRRMSQVSTHECYGALECFGGLPCSPNPWMCWEAVCLNVFSQGWESAYTLSVIGGNFVSTARNAQWHAGPCQTAVCEWYTERSDCPHRSQDLQPAGWDTEKPGSAQPLLVRHDLLCILPLLC